MTIEKQTISYIAADAAHQKRDCLVCLLSRCAAGSDNGRSTASHPLFLSRPSIDMQCLHSSGILHEIYRNRPSAPCRILFWLLRCKFGNVPDVGFLSAAEPGALAPQQPQLDFTGCRTQA